MGARIYTRKMRSNVETLHIDGTLQHVQSGSNTLTDILTGSLII